MDPDVHFLRACGVSLGQDVPPWRVPRAHKRQRGAGEIDIWTSGTYAERVKVRDLIRLIEVDGWTQVACEGSHRQFRHPNKKGRVTIPGHPSDELAPKTLRSILTQAGLSQKMR